MGHGSSAFWMVGLAICETSGLFSDLWLIRVNRRITREQNGTPAAVNLGPGTKAMHLEGWQSRGSK